jgi:hypothetical protein
VGVTGGSWGGCRGGCRVSASYWNPLLSPLAASKWDTQPNVSARWWAFFRGSEVIHKRKRLVLGPGPGLVPPSLKTTKQVLEDI